LSQTQTEEAIMGKNYVNLSVNATKSG